MNEVLDCRGVAIRITAERLAHALEHPEMAALEAGIAATLTSPEVVIRSRTDRRVELYYRFCRRTREGEVLWRRK